MASSISGYIYTLFNREIIISGLDSANTPASQLLKFLDLFSARSRVEILCAAESPGRVRALHTWFTVRMRGNLASKSAKKTRIKANLQQCIHFTIHYPRLFNHQLQ